MSRVFVIIGSLLLLAGCVSETLINGEKVSQKQHVVNKTAAAKTRLGLALRYLEAGNAEQAKRNLDLAQKLAPKMPQVYLTQGHFYQHVKQVERAAKAFEQGLDLAPNDGDILNNYGAMLCQQGDFERADELFNRAIANPDYVNVAATNENAGLCAHRAGKLDKALVYFEKALAYNHRRPLSLLAAADLSLAKGEYSQVREYLQHYDNVAEASASSLFSWVRLERAQDNFAAEARWGMELKRLFPNAEQTKRYIANDY